jgi:hypothetical protein
MDRRKLILSGMATAGLSACASTAQDRPRRPAAPVAVRHRRGRDLFGRRDDPQRLGLPGRDRREHRAVIERAFRDNGRPTGYIAGEEGSGAIGVGLRYGRGLLYMKGKDTQEVFWQGPSVGWDWGGNASRVFTLCYNLQYPDAIFRRFPGVEGTAYLVGGLGVNYQRADTITLAPIRAGVGLRLGANVGYLAYSRQRNILPF